VVGAGAIALGVGAVYGLSARSTWSDSKAHCRDQGGTLVCDGEGVGLVNDTIRNGNVSTLLLGAGLAVIGTGTVLWLTAPRARTEHRLAVAPSWSPHGAALSMTGRF
jgi:hypothetical protein